MVFDSRVSILEKNNDILANEVAKEGIVLLKNDGTLPLKTNQIALYGAGARRTCKGGTGSGEVNNRSNISIEKGLELCGVTITSKRWLNDCEKDFIHEDEIRIEKIKALGKKYSIFNFRNLMEAAALPIIFPSGRNIDYNDVKDSNTDTAIFILSRQAGEGKDRKAINGEYYPLDREIENLKFLCENYKHVVLVINSGSSIEMDELLKFHLSAIIFMGQAGQTGGLALAELLLGKNNFSGKLACTWPKKLADLPCFDSFSYLDNNVDRELYKDGIYVGYRYFDSFNVEPCYPFGYGLSYTRFNINAKASIKNCEVVINASIKNIGKVSGKEVIQVYLSCPSNKIKREYQSLATFIKTKELDNEEEDNYTLSFDLRDFAAFDERENQYILEKGNYIIRVGNSSRNTKAIATIILNETYIVEKCQRILKKDYKVEEIKAPVCNKNNQIDGEAIVFSYDIPCISHLYNLPDMNVLDIAHKMSGKELVNLCCGDPAMMSGRLLDVVGSCGQINRKVSKKYGYKPAVMADGPAGLRLTKEFAIEPNGKIKTTGKLPKELVIAKKFFEILDRLWSKKSKKARAVYQFCTAWPSATLQAQTFSPELIEKIGDGVAQEMRKYGVGIWLAPSMNIQRFPLCGRNFEYYSEDPILSAKMASALTRGVQKEGDCAVTIKHFCCNNQEDNRMKNSSEVNERALREIYLKAFKLTIRDGKPKCVMSSYNKVNGTYVNSTYNLITNTLRNEFGFNGLVMTDWQSVAKGQAKAYEVLAAENDLIMAGDKYQHDELLRGLKKGKVNRSTLERSASRILSLCKDLEK